MKFVVIFAQVYSQPLYIYEKTIQSIYALFNSVFCCLDVCYLSQESEEGYKPWPPKRGKLNCLGCEE